MFAHGDWMEPALIIGPGFQHAEFVRLGDDLVDHGQYSANRGKRWRGTGRVAQSRSSNRDDRDRGRHHSRGVESIRARRDRVCYWPRKVDVFYIRTFYLSPLVLHFRSLANAKKSP